MARRKKGGSLTTKRGIEKGLTKEHINGERKKIGKWAEKEKGEKKRLRI